MSGFDDPMFWQAYDQKRNLEEWMAYARKLEAALAAAKSDSDANRETASRLSCQVAGMTAVADVLARYASELGDPRGLLPDGGIRAIPGSDLKGPLRAAYRTGMEARATSFKGSDCKAYDIPLRISTADDKDASLVAGDKVWDAICRPDGWQEAEPKPVPQPVRKPAPQPDRFAGLKEFLSG